MRHSGDPRGVRSSHRRTLGGARLVRHLLSLGLLLLALALATSACRELTAPTQTHPNMILAQALVLDPTNLPAGGIHVSIRPQTEEHAASFSAQLVTDEEGRFELWVPNEPLSITFRPERGSKVPNEHRESVLFFRNEVRRFVLRGDYHLGTVGPARYADSLKVSRVTMGTYVDRFGGGQDGLSASTSVNVGGNFEIYLPQEGRFTTRITRCCDFSVDYTWPDSIEVARGDTIHLEVPVVPFQIGFTMGGVPVPPGALSYSTLSSDRHNEIGKRLFTVEQQEFFDLPGLLGATRIEVVPYLSTALFGSPIVSGNFGVLGFAPVAVSIPPLTEGDVFSIELGQYELQLQVLDPQGDPLDKPGIELLSETLRQSKLDLHADEQGRAVLRVNPVGHELLVNADGYLSTRRYFTVTGDMQMTITLQPIPDEN